ncbi:MAG: hypothetical protein ACWA40_05475 [Planktomarina sp.]
MSKSITTFAVLASAVLMAACTAQTKTDAVEATAEYVIVEPAPISVEPVHTGKYK